MRREEKCQALLLEGKGYQKRTEMLPEPRESAKGPKDKKDCISVGPTTKGGKSSDTRSDLGICCLPIKQRLKCTSACIC